MLRVRNTDGQTIEISQSYRFVELCDLDGKVAKVFYVDDHNAIHEVVAESREAERYKRLFKVDFVPLSKMPEV